MTTCFPFADFISNTLEENDTSMGVTFCFAFTTSILVVKSSSVYGTQFYFTRLSI
jgi:hypothetical protein